MQLYSPLILVSGSDTCVSLSKKYGISLNDFYDLNPKVHRGTCDNLDNGKKYCVKAGYSSSSKESDNDDDSILSKVTSLTSKSSGTEKRKKMQTQAVFTYYWIAHENDYTGGKKVSIKTCSGKTIAKVSENYADALVMEGTGVVGNQIVNLGGCSCSGYKCFETINRSEEPYGITGKSQRNSKRKWNRVGVAQYTCIFSLRFCSTPFRDHCCQ